MKHMTIHALGSQANVVAHEALPLRVVRRARLERFAALLEAHKGTLRLFSSIEYMSRSKREALQADDSPLTVAYRDATFRAEGLASDRLGDAATFFRLTTSETHHLLCDCHYGAHAVAAQLIALRARKIAGKRGLGERWQQLCHATDRAWRRLAPMS
jgi:hypothetical protein